MSQELTDAEFLRRLAGAIGHEFSQSDPKIARLHSIADRLERPGVEGVVFCDDSSATEYWGVDFMKRPVGVKPGMLVNVSINRRETL